MRLYKITNIESCSKYNTAWGNNCTRTLHPTTNPQLCTNDVFHAYTNKNLALLFNPIHSNYQPFQLWEAKGKVVVKDWSKVGCFELTTIKQSKIPIWYTNKFIRLKVIVGFAKLCAHAARAARADAATWAATWAAASAADATTWAAANAADAADAAANAAAWAAAAWAAASAADATTNNIDFIKLAKQAIKEAQK